MRLLALLFLCFACVNATHWAYGTAVWHLLTGGPTTTSRAYNFTLNLAFRRSYFNPLPTAPPYGPTNGPYPPSGSSPAVLGFWSCGATCVASGTSLGTLSISMVPQDIIPLGDWFTGRVNFVRNFTGASVANNNIFWEYYNCCRLSSINDTNHDLNWRITGVINRYATDSPSTTSVPRDYESIGFLVLYSIIASHPAGRPLNYSIAGTACNGQGIGSCLTNGIPTATYTCSALSTVCQEISGPMTINPTLGNVIWSPKTLGLFSVQYTITEVNLYPGETGGQRTTIPLDMLFEITPPQPAPYFYAPFALSVPPSQRVITFYRGVEGQYPVCARSNATGAVVDINPVGLPAGSTWTFTMSGHDALGAYTCYLVKWAPLVDSVPTTACFLAKDTVNGILESRKLLYSHDPW